MPSIITLQYTSHVTGKTNHDCSDSLVVTCVPPTQPLLFGTDIPLSMAFILSKGVVGELQPLACHLCYKFVLSLQAPPTALWTQCTGCVCKGSCLQLGSVPNIPRGHWASMTMHGFQGCPKLSHRHTAAFTSPTQTSVLYAGTALNGPFPF